MSLPVKYFRSAQSGAPVLSGTKGTMISVLDACLISGFNLKPITNLTWAEGVAKVTIDGGHGYLEDDIVLVEGAEQPGYNGEHRIRVLSPTQFTWLLPDDPLASPATGSLTVKIAPIGWDKVFAATNKAVYRSRRPEGTGYLLRVNHDSDTRYARVRGFLSMTDVDTGLEPFPTTGVNEGGLHWAASGYANTSAREWSLIGDAGMFFLLVRSHDSYGIAFYGFGDISTYKPGDAHHCILMGQEANDPYYAYAGFANGNMRADTGRYIAKRYFQVGGTRSFIMSGSAMSGSFGRGLPFPSPIDNAVHFYRVQVQDDSVRGDMPGVIQCIEEYPFSHRFVLKGVPGLGDSLRDILFHDVYDGRVCFDLTGPWR